MQKTAQRKRIGPTGAMLASLAAALLFACCSPEEELLPPATTQLAPPKVTDPLLSVNTLIDAPEDFARLRIDTPEFSIPKYAKFLEGVRICLDPGHGGDADQRGYKRGPTGVREAEINLRVARYLRDFLEFVGAEVLMTRDGDDNVSLEARAEIANDWPARLFVSCHHNASETNPDANYTSVWYHGEVDERPSNLDLARHLCMSLLDGLPLDQVADVGLRSDLLMYKQGFRVLRDAEVTAALVETSFFTNPAEEQRLRDPQYNLREAYALFLGLARYAAQGLPGATLIGGTNALSRTAGTIEFDLDDGLRGEGSWGHEHQMILSDTIAVFVDDRRCDHALGGEDYRLSVTLPPRLSPGEHRVRLNFQNIFKSSNLNPDFTLRLR